MKFSCQKNILLDALTIVSKATAIRSSKEIYECILIKATVDGITLIANDLQMGIESNNLVANVENEGEIALEAKLLQEIVRKMPEGIDINFNVDTNFITTISSGKVEFKILGNSSEDFSKLTIVDKTNFCTVSSNEFKNMIRQTIFSVSIDDSKPTFCGETIEISDGYLTIYSLDAFRISHRKTKIDNNELKATVIVPTKTLNELSKILSTEKDDEVTFYFTDKHIQFETKECIMVSRLIEGESFNCNTVFNNDYTTVVELNKDQLLMSFERTSLICKDVRKNPVKVSINDSLITLSINTETGTSQDELTIIKDGNDLDIAFNPRYFIDALKAIDEEDIKLFMTSPLSPCIILSDSNPDFKYLLLPLRV